MSQKHPAAFINAIADEGSKKEAIKYLQEIWDDYVDLKAELAECKSKFNELDLCQLGGAPCEYALRLNEQLAELEGDNAVMEQSCRDVELAIDDVRAQLAERDARIAELEENYIEETVSLLIAIEKQGELNERIAELEHWLPIWANALEDERQWSGLARQMRALQPDTQESE